MTTPNCRRAATAATRVLPRAMAALAALGVGAAASGQTMLGPTPYLCAEDSPFHGLSLGYFELETFEDHLLNVPGVSANRGGVTSVVFGPSAHDSVDCDDGAIDGLGLAGDSFFSGVPDVTFTFDAGVLGTLPTHAGLVWTDGGFNAHAVFEAYDAAGVIVGSVAGTVGEGGNFGETGEDRFFGVIYAGGIGAIRIRHDSGGLEVDHLQYGGGGEGGGCRADFNGDGFLDFFDYDDYVNCFETGACPPGKTADFNGDGFADFFDYADFVDAFERGC